MCFLTMGNTLSRCCGRESKPPKRKRKSKQSELEIALFECPKVDSYMGLPLAEVPGDVSELLYVCFVFSLCTQLDIFFLSKRVKGIYVEMYKGYVHTVSLPNVFTTAKMTTISTIKSLNA